MRHSLRLWCDGATSGCSNALAGSILRVNTLSKDDIRLLVNIGFAACIKGKVAPARTLFENLLVVYPEMAPVKVGLSFSHLVVNDFAQGEQLLQEVIDAGDPEQEAVAFLAFAKALQKKADEAQELAAQVKEENSVAYNLAQEALQLLEA